MSAIRRNWRAWYVCSECALSNGHAVKQLLLLQFLISAVNSWTFGGVFDADLFVVSGGSNSFVGLVESAKGVVGLATAVPLGVLADILPRVKFFRLLLAVGLPASSIVVIGLLGKQQGWLLAGAVAFAILLQGLSGNLNALFADFTMPGRERAQVMSWQGMVTQFGNCAGSLIQMVLLLCAGSQEHWDPNLLGVYLSLGMLLLLFTVPLVFCMREPSTEDLQGDGSSPNTSIASLERPANVVPQWATRRVCSERIEVKWLVVFLLEISFVVGLFCTGMSVKYFPLFFKKDFGFSPAGISALNAAFPFVVMIVIPLCVRLSRYVGQVQGILIWTILGTGCLALLALSENAMLAVVMFLSRSAFMKSRDPIFQALLMDCLEERHRGKFGAVTSVRSATWAGSAFVGGIFLDHHDSNYRGLFLLTSAVTLIHIFMMVPLLCVVPVSTLNTQPVGASTCDLVEEGNASGGKPLPRVEEEIDARNLRV